nr:MAG TPA: hypothetical protein [Bacteriophage sp.]
MNGIGFAKYVFSKAYDTYFKLSKFLKNVALIGKGISTSLLINLQFLKVNDISVIFVLIVDIVPKVKLSVVPKILQL